MFSYPTAAIFRQRVEDANPIGAATPSASEMRVRVVSQIWFGPAARDSFEKIAVHHSPRNAGQTGRASRSASNRTRWEIERSTPQCPSKVTPSAARIAPLATTRIWRSYAPACLPRRHVLRKLAADLQSINRRALPRSHSSGAVWQK